MYEWQKQIQFIVDEIDKSIKNHDDEALTLSFLSQKLGYSSFYTTKKFKEILGIQFRDYMRHRKLSFALKEVRDGDKTFLQNRIRFCFSSHEALTRAFKKSLCVTLSAYRKYPQPVVLRTKINPFDRYFLGLDEVGIIKSKVNVVTYFVSIDAHKFLYIGNHESNGYWNFWQKQSHIVG